MRGMGQGDEGPILREVFGDLLPEKAQALVLTPGLGQAADFVMGELDPMMKGGGALVTMSYYGAQKVIPNYGIMGPVKAALEATVRALAAELGPGGIRVHAVSPGPIRTRAASGIG
eukprot:gene7904-biopygen6632